MSFATLSGRPFSPDTRIGLTNILSPKKKETLASPVYPANPRYKYLDNPFFRYLCVKFILCHDPELICDRLIRAVRLRRLADYSAYCADLKKEKAL